MYHDRTGEAWTTQGIGKVLRKIHPQLGRHKMRYTLGMLSKTEDVRSF